jgi:hypothetical protein
MLNKNTKIKIQNRNNGIVGYSVPDMNVRRVFQPNEKKEITYEELQKLSYTPGGLYLLNNYLIIYNNEARETLIGEVELEYNYTEEDVKNLLLQGSLDELLDCLDFAPDGVISLVKDLAVKLEIVDLSKRKAIQEKTGLNVTKAIENNNARNASDVAETAAPARRVVQTEEKSAQPTPGEQVRRSVVKK